MSVHTKLQLIGPAVWPAIDNVLFYYIEHNFLFQIHQLSDYSILINGKATFLVKQLIAFFKYKLQD